MAVEAMGLVLILFLSIICFTA